MTRCSRQAARTRWNSASEIVPAASTPRISAPSAADSGWTEMSSALGRAIAFACPMRHCGAHRAISVKRPQRRRLYSGAREDWMRRPPHLLPLLAWLACLAALPAAAQEGAGTAFYRGKTVTIFNWTTPGGGYDAFARMLARSIGKYLPGNPTVIVKSLEGAGGFTELNYLYTMAPKDG